MSLNKFENAKVLIVDDEPSNLRVLYNLLKEYPLRIFAVQDSLLAMNAIERDMPDIILLDIMMPGMNGFELCRLIRNRNDFSEISVILISALNDTASIVKGFELGAVDYISKPFRNEEVVARLSNHLTMKFQSRELTKLIQELGRKNRELEELNSMKNKFFSIIAHDIKNPFTGILGISDLLHTDYDALDAEERKEMFGQLYGSAQSCCGLLENLLEWANSQLNRIQNIPKRNSLSQTVNKVFEVYALPAEQKKIRLISEISERTEYFADENIVNLIIRNLVNNAVKFTEENGTVSISSTEKGEYLEIYVKDTGIGMPKEISENLFRIDTKVSRKGVNKEPGTGLGLLVSSEFAQKSGIKISVQSEEGIGTVFTVVLPAVTFSQEEVSGKADYN